MGVKDEVMRHIVPGTLVYQWHSDTINKKIELAAVDTFARRQTPVVLADSTSSKRSHVDAFRVGPLAYGLQFHPELAAETIEQYCPKLAAETIEQYCGAVAPSRKVEDTGRAALESWLKIAMRARRTRPRIDEM
jgi:GMP synthase-like glutamine amidotransferase